MIFHEKVAIVKVPSLYLIPALVQIWFFVLFKSIKLKFYHFLFLSCLKSSICSYIFFEIVKFSITFLQWNQFFVWIFRTRPLCLQCLFVHSVVVMETSFFILLEESIEMEIPFLLAFCYLNIFFLTNNIQLFLQVYWNKSKCKVFFDAAIFRLARHVTFVVRLMICEYYCDSSFFMQIISMCLSVSWSSIQQCIGLLDGQQVQFYGIV